MTREARRYIVNRYSVTSLQRRIDSRFTIHDSRSSAFTMIELLIVMGIIIILAGLVIGTSGYVQKKGARSRAEAEIAAMSAACESYKADNGIYPQGNADPSSQTGQSDTATLDPQTMGNPTAAQYTNASLALYNLLAGATTKGSRTTTSKSYMSFKPNQLSPSDQTQAVAYIRDPFGNSYGYSTMKASGAADGYNPTFDLWSTAGVTSSGVLDQSQWIKNW